MGVVDTAVVGRAGAVPLAGVGLGNALFFTVAVVGIGLMMGLDPLIAQAFGAGDPARARRLLWQGGFALGDGGRRRWRCRWRSSPSRWSPSASSRRWPSWPGTFVLWRLPGLPFLFLYVGGRAYLSSAGHTRPMVIATVVANLRQPAARRAAGLRRRGCCRPGPGRCDSSRRWAAPARPSAAA